MIDFEYYNPAKIVFGEHSEQKLRELLAAYGVKSLQLVYSGDFIKTLGIYDVIRDAVKKLGIRFSENGNVVPNPTIDLVRELVKQGKENQVDFVLAVGGGSSIDTAKAVALGIPYDGACGISLKKASRPSRFCRLA
ncbi:MAG: iron-containing alcohol dehydrogenase [Fibrobacter sp.]|nr:iron-containing alcohol dehydrogenase [Fibrobacter sp.]MBS7270837.1 iron-containing alcohol dehydrogenase [Fibrobacter sp.]